jgi:NAD(P)H-hydrate epimerase
MKLLTAQQIRKWDKYTIENEPIASIDLMERAAHSFCQWFLHQKRYLNKSVTIFCGNGYNGGDGLAIARILRDQFYEVKVLVLRFAKEDSTDFDINLGRLMALGDVEVQFIHNESLNLKDGGIAIDALLGTGVNKPVEGTLWQLISKINDHAFESIISVDMPSGLPSEGLTSGIAITPDVIFTFQLPKLSFFYPEHEKYCPEWVVGDIGLHQDYLHKVQSDYEWVDLQTIRSFFKRRKKFQHKGDFGHVLMIAGSEGKMGAAILAAKAAIRAGTGLVTAMVPHIGVDVIHEVIPEVMVAVSGQTCFNIGHEINNEKGTVGIGPGLGMSKKTISAFECFLKKLDKPVVFDADALNILGQNPQWISQIPPYSILTPHPKEFERLFGRTENSHLMFERQLEMSVKFQLIIVLKGAYTRITTPEGRTFINSTGNPGMATAGSGDVLTGIITSLLAQHYSPEQSAIFGVYVHGLAGDLALRTQNEASLIATDIIAHLGGAFNSIENL